MKIIICQPQDDYFLWQLKVQMENLRGMDVVILLAYVDRIRKQAADFRSKTNAEVIFYKDDRKRPLVYFPSVVPHLMAKYFSDHNGEPFLYIGADCLMVNKPELPIREKVFLAAASSITSHYIKSRDEGLFKWMCIDAGISTEIVEANDINCGGAQHLFNVVPDKEYWREMEIVSYNLFDRITEWNFRNPTKRVQAWTAGMWALLWGLWKRGIQTEVSPILNHSWPSYDIERLKDFNFFHNAGVTEKRPDLFFKGKFREFPPTLKDLDVDPRYCSWWYAQQIKKGLNLEA